MQEYEEIPAKKTLRDSRVPILNNDKTVASHYAGTVFPTEHLIVGMECYRTDLDVKYRLVKLPGDWRPVLTAREIMKVKADNATSADRAAVAGKLETPRRINGKLFDGTGDIQITAAPTAHTHDDRYQTKAEAAAQLEQANKKIRQEVNEIVTTAVAAPHGSDIFFANYVFTVPAGCKQLQVSGCAARGASGNSVRLPDSQAHAPSYWQSFAGGLGGLGARVYRHLLSVTPGEKLQITIGKAGSSSSCGALILPCGSRGGDAWGSTVGTGHVGNPGANASLQERSDGHDEAHFLIEW